MAIHCRNTAIEVRIADAPGGRHIRLVTTDDSGELPLILDLENAAAQALLDDLGEGLRQIRARHGNG